MAKSISGLPKPKEDFHGIAERTLPRDYVKFSEKIAFNYGYKEAILLGILMNKHDSLDRYWQLPSDGSFYISINALHNRSGMNRKTIYKTIDTLAKKGFLEYDPGEQGVAHSHRYYRLNEEVIKLAAQGMDPMELHKVCKNGLSQKRTTPLSQKGDTPMVKTDHPCPKNGIGGYPKIGTHNRSIEANIEAIDKREKGGADAPLGDSPYSDDDADPRAVVAVENEVTENIDPMCQGPANFDLQAAIKNLMQEDTTQATEVNPPPV